MLREDLPVIITLPFVKTVTQDMSHRYSRSSSKIKAPNEMSNIKMGVRDCLRMLMFLGETDVLPDAVKQRSESLEKKKSRRRAEERSKKMKEKGKREEAFIAGSSLASVGFTWSDTKTTSDVAFDRILLYE